MATELTNPIENYDTPWDGHTGQEVEAFVKGKLQAHEQRMDGIDEKVDTAAQATKYVVQLLRDGSGPLVSIGGAAKVRLRFTSISLTPNGTPTPDRADANEDGTLTVESRFDSAKPWTVRKTLTLTAQPYESTDWTEIDLAPHMPDGKQEVRLTVKGNATELTTGSVTLQVTKTNLALEFASRWERPVTDGVLPLQYRIDGAVAKTLHIKVDGGGEIAYGLGSATYTESPYQVSVGKTISGADLSHDIHSIEAWLTVDGTDKATPHVVSQMFVQADPDNTGTYIAVNGAAGTLTNWASQTLLQYAVFKNGADSVPLTFEITDSSGNAKLMSVSAGEVKTGTKYDLTNMLEIDTTKLQQTVKMQFVSGQTTLPVKAATLDNANAADFAPAQDADFYLNPRTRTNGESTRAAVINAASGQSVGATFSGIAFTTDGWVADGNGQRCLRVPSGASVGIDYETFADYIRDDSSAHSLTVELDIASRNAYDLSEAVIRMCTTNADGRTVGIEVCPRETTVLTTVRQERGDQNVYYCEDVRTHIVINLVYDIDASGMNIARIFVNGVPNREFEWTESDRFAQPIDGKTSSQGIRIGSSQADVDVYGIRVYKRALTAAEIRRNYMSTMATTREKTDFRDANAITGQGGEIDYAKARDKYNTILITGTIPNYFRRSDTVCDWDINILGDPEHSCRMTAMITAGQGTSSKSYGEWNLSAKAQGGVSKIIDSKGVERDFDGYQLDDSVPKATKLVGKINWASSMQSHKMGACNLINDLRRAVGDLDSILAADPTARVAVKQKPFLVFVRATEQDAPRYHAVFTFGPGKGDKATFGYSKSNTDYLQIEGADNGEPLTNHHMPWTEAVEYNAEKESYLYANAKQWDPVMGNLDRIDVFAAANNFVYLCSPLIKPYVGSLEDMWDDATAKAKAASGTMFWPTIPGSSNAYDLYRWDKAQQTWVDAGATYTDGTYGKLNLAEQLGETPSPDNEAANRQFIAKRIVLFKAGFEQHYHKTGMLFSQAVRKLLALSDNWAKNTYQYLASTGEGEDKRLIISEAFDDNDTMGPVENVGRTNKPYYVEEHDVAPDGKPYWNADANALYLLIEMAYPGELRNMMKTLLTEMQRLGGSLEGCIDKYFFSTQRLLPAVVYSENARLHYERYEKLYGTGQGQYNASVHPLAQSLGSLLECERQWWKDRLVYLSSYAGFGQFAMNGAGSMTFRSRTNTQGNDPAYAFELTPHMWLYPSVSVGSSTQFGSGNDLPRRVKAGDSVTLAGLSGGNDVNIQLHGIDYYDKIGQFGDKSLGADFTISGSYLTEFRADSQPMEFRPTSLTVAAPNLRTLILRGVATLTGTLNMSKATRLHTIDLTGTRLTGYTIGNPAAVQSLGLPETVETLNLDGYTALEQSKLTIKGLSKVTSLTLRNCPLLDSKAIVERLVADSAPLDGAKCSIDGVDWTDVKTSTLLYLAGRGVKLTGRAVLADGQRMTFADKIAIIAAFGEIDKPTNGLYVNCGSNYKVLQDANIGMANRYIGAPGDYQLSLVPTNDDANDVTKIEWSIEANDYATVNPATGMLHVSQTGAENTDGSGPHAVATCTVTMLGGSTLTRTRDVHFHPRTARIGDAVYHDGVWDDEYDPTKTLIGICHIIENRPAPLTPYREMIAPRAICSAAWGLSAGLKRTDGSTFIGVGILENYSTGGNIDDSSMLNTDGTFKDYASNVHLGRVGMFQLDRPYRLPTTAPTYRTAEGEVQPEGTSTPGTLQDFDKGQWISYSQYETLTIVKVRNKVLTSTDPRIERLIPAASKGRNEQTDLSQCIADFSPSGQSSAQYHFEAASRCYAYHPTMRSAKHILADRFREHNWCLPSMGSLMRAFYLQKKSEGDSPLAVFKQWLTRKLVDSLSGNTWSSSECNGSGVWVCSPGGVHSYNKLAIGHAVRPVAAF